MVSPGATPERVLLVEGADDKHVVGHLCERAGIADLFEFKDKNGVDGLLNSISVEAKIPGLASLGIIADANNNIGGRWQAIADRLALRGVSIPPNPQPGGTVKRWST